MINVPRDPAHEPDPAARRNCPVCEDMIMMQHFFSVKRHVAVDECPKCGGVWLDAGELGGIRDLFETEEARRQAAAEYFGELFDKDIAAMKAESDEKRAKSQKFGRMFRWLWPQLLHPRQTGLGSLLAAAALHRKNKTPFARKKSARGVLLFRLRCRGRFRRGGG